MGAAVNHAAASGAPALTLVPSPSEVTLSSVPCTMTYGKDDGDANGDGSRTVRAAFKSIEEGAFTLACDGITDPGNLGAILRTAECAGVTGVVLPRHRAAHITPTVAKTAAGAVEHLRMVVVGGLPATMKTLSQRGIWTVGLDAGGERSIFDLPVADEPVALVVGAEGSGLSRLVRERCDTIASIPMAGVLDSLNVSNAAAISVYEITRRRAEASGGN